MYSGTTLTNYSGNIMGAHQKIDKMARKQLAALLHENDSLFPSKREILRFEGKNGPDGIKRKSPAQNEPWHYFNPFNEEDNELRSIISEHYKLLVEALREKNNTRAAFEAAWLAHAIVDGLTPAHHYPYEEELQKLRGDEGKETRNTIAKKIIMPGARPAEQVANNWKMWGPGGLMTSHGTFEFGVATIIAPLKAGPVVLDKKVIESIQKNGIVPHFVQCAKEIAAMDLFLEYHKRGWTSRLARKVRHELTPTIVSTVMLAWYGAYMEANKAAK